MHKLTTIIDEIVIDLLHAPIVGKFKKKFYKKFSTMTDPERL